MSQIQEGYTNGYITVIAKSSDEVQIERNKKLKHPTIFWDCKCLCGKIFPVGESRIDRTKSCGCSRKKYLDPDIINQEIGNVYGDLTIIAFDREATIENNQNGKRYGAYYVCRCKCGTIKTYRLNSIKYGHIKSCGCSKKDNPKIMHDLTGKRFGRLTVRSRNYDHQNGGNVKWNCDCDCGGSTIATGYNLEHGYTKSCGCLVSDIISERNRVYSAKSGKTGVYKNHDKWYAYITVNYNSIFLGSYDDFQDAVNARIAAEQQYGFTCDNIVADYDKINRQEELKGLTKE